MKTSIKLVGAAVLAAAALHTAGAVAAPGDVTIAPAVMQRNFGSAAGRTVRYADYTPSDTPATIQEVGYRHRHHHGHYHGGYARPYYAYRPYYGYRPYYHRPYYAPYYSGYRPYYYGTGYAPYYSFYSSPVYGGYYYW